MIGTLKTVDFAERSSGRMEHLDSCRGIAALLVVASHCIGALDVNKQYEMIRAPLGHLPVLFFFLLSGLVLGRSITASAPTFINYLKYFIRRVFRLYPALIAVMLLAFLIASTLSSEFAWKEQVSERFSNLYVWMSQVRTWGQLEQNILLMQRGLDVPTWTIKVEIVCSLILPLLIWITPHLYTKLVVLAALMFFASPLYDHIFHPPVADLPISQCARYLYLFYAGYLLVSLTVWRPCVSRKRALLLLLISLSGIVAGIVFDWESDLLSAAFLTSLLFVLLPCPVIRLRKLLSSWSMHLIGKVSYSLYLLHLPILILFMNKFGVLQKLHLNLNQNIILLYLLVAGTSLFVAVVLYYLIEAPLNLVGHKLSKALSF